jgi:hypothetical protein
MFSSEDEAEPPPDPNRNQDQGMSKDKLAPTMKTGEKRARQSSSESLSPAPDLPVVLVANDDDDEDKEKEKGRRGNKRGRRSDPAEERAKSNGTAGTSGRGSRGGGDQSMSVRGRSRSNVSETPSVSMMTSGHGQSSRISNLKGKQRESRMSTLASPAPEHGTDNWVYPALYPYPLPLTSMDPSRQPTPAPTDSRPKARHSRTSFTPSTATVTKPSNSNKRFSAGGASDTAQHSDSSPNQRYYERNRINPPAYLSLPSGSASADLINSRFFGNEFALPLFADPEVVAEWNGRVRGSKNESEGIKDGDAVGLPEQLGDAQGWMEMVYERPERSWTGGRDMRGKSVGPEKTPDPELMTYEVKKEVIEEGEQDDTKKTEPPIPEPEVGRKNAATETTAEAGEADDPTSPQTQMQVDVYMDQVEAEAEAEMDVDMQLMGDEGDQKDSAHQAIQAEQSSIVPVPENLNETALDVQMDEPEPLDKPDDVVVANEDRKKSPVASRPAERRSSLAALLAPVPAELDEQGNGGEAEPIGAHSIIQPDEEEDLDPEFRGTTASEPVSHDVATLVPVMTMQQAMSIEIPSSSMSIPLPGASSVRPGQPRSPEQRDDRRTSTRQSSGRGLHSSSPRESGSLQSSIPFMLNPVDQDVPPSPNGHGLGPPDAFSSATSTGNFPPPFTSASSARRTSFPQPMPYQSPMPVNLESQLISPQGFHIVPRTPRHTGRFSLELPSTPLTPLGPSQRTEAKLAPRSPTPPRMSTGPADLPSGPFIDPFPPVSLPTPSPSVSIDEAKEDMETDDMPQTPATSPMVVEPSKVPETMKTRKKPSVDLAPVTVPSSSRSRSTESPEKPTRVGRTTARSNSVRGRGASRGHSRARDTSSARRSTQSTASSTPQRVKSPPPVQSTRPRPKQAKRLQSINEGATNGESAGSSKRQNSGRPSLTTLPGNRIDRPMPSVSRQSTSNSDLRLASQLSYEDDTTDHHSAVGSEDELALKPKETKKKKHSPPQPEQQQQQQQQSQPSGSSGTSKDVKKKPKTQPTQPPPSQPIGPTGPAKATRSNDTNPPKSTRRMTRSKR